MRGVPLVCVARHAACRSACLRSKAPKARPPRGTATTGKPWPSSMSSAIPTSGCSAVANFFVYTIRYAMLDWGPTLLTQAKHLQLTNAGWMVAGFEISGMIGALIGGWLTDRLFGGRGFRSCVFYMALAGVSILLFWKVAGQSVWLNTAAPLPLGLLHLRPAMPHQHCRRQSRHQTRRRHRRRPDRLLRLRQHDPFRLGFGQAGANLRLGCRVHRHAHRRSHRHVRLCARLEGQGARLRGLKPLLGDRCQRGAACAPKQMGEPAAVGIPGGIYGELEGRPGSLLGSSS